MKYAHTFIRTVIKKIKKPSKIIDTRRLGGKQESTVNKRSETNTEIDC